MTRVTDLARRHARRLSLFGVVGISGVVVNSAVLWALVSLAGMNHLVAAMISSELSILSNFVLNDRFTFAGHPAPISYMRRAAHYNAVALSGMVISLGVLAVLTVEFNMYYLAANLIAIGSATLSNYALNTRFTWSIHLETVGQPAEAGA